MTFSLFFLYSSDAAIGPTPAQDAIKKEIDKRSMELDFTERRKRSLVADGSEHEKVRKLRQEIDDFEKQLKHKKKQRVYSMKHRKIKNKK